MAGHARFGIPGRFLSVALALLVAGCADDRSTTPALISIDAAQMTAESPDGAFWGVVDVLEKDGVIWVLSPADPFVHGLRSGAEVAAFGTRGEGPGELQSARALLPLGDIGEITVWDAAARLHRTFSGEGQPVSTREAREIGTVRGDIDIVTFGDPLRVATTPGGGTVRGEFAGTVSWGSDLWTATLVRTDADGSVERIVDFGDLRGASHEDVSTKSLLVPVPLWDACPDGSVVVLDPMARFVYLVESGWQERDSLSVPWDVGPISPADRVSYIAAQMRAELQGQQFESSQLDAMAAQAEEMSRDRFPALAPLAVDIRCSGDRVWMQEYDGAARPLGFSRTWRTVPVAGASSSWSEVILPPAFQLFRVSDSHLLGVVTDDTDLQRVVRIPLPQSLRAPQ